MDKLTIISGCLFLAADIFAIASLANPDWINTGESAGEGGPAAGTRRRGGGGAAGGRGSRGRAGCAPGAAEGAGLPLRGRSSGGGRGAWRRDQGEDSPEARPGRRAGGAAGPGPPGGCGELPVPAPRCGEGRSGRSGLAGPSSSRDASRPLPPGAGGMRSAEPCPEGSCGSPHPPSALGKAQGPGDIPAGSPESVTLEWEGRSVSLHSLWQVLNLSYYSDVSFVAGNILLSFISFFQNISCVLIFISL